MFDLLLRIYRRLVHSTPSPLSDSGERVDIDLCSNPHYALMDLYQKSHYKRYVFAKQYVQQGMVCGDFACGSGYGSAMLAQAAGKVTGVDIKQHVVDAVSERYSKLHNVEFVCHDLRHITFDNVYDLIVSFETIEHVEEHDVIGLFNNFSRALKNGGILIFSTPYLQKRSREAIEMGFHLTFDVDEEKIASWLAQTGFSPERFLYQSYKSHDVVTSLADKDFVLCVARKTEVAT
ncbi:MAG: class I SAM-dependent methyltransferase [Smithellaceae bacterium]